MLQLPLFGLPQPLDSELLDPEYENSMECRADPEADVALLVEKTLSPKDENETAELGGSVTELSLIHLRFGTRISVPFSPSDMSPLLVL
jgi:hypothetical protein